MAIATTGFLLFYLNQLAAWAATDTQVKLVDCKSITLSNATVDARIQISYDCLVDLHTIITNSDHVGFFAWEDTARQDRSRVINMAAAASILDANPANYYRLHLSGDFIIPTLVSAASGAQLDTKDFLAPSDVFVLSATSATGQYSYSRLHLDSVPSHC